jgi:protease-4
MKKFLLGVLVGFLFTGLALVIFFFVVVRLRTRPPDIPRDALLVLAPQGEIPESPPAEIPLPFFERRSPLTVRETWEVLRKAAADRRIRGLLFMPAGLEIGWAKAQEIRRGLETFRKSGKPVYAFLRGPRTREYYIATAADRIYMSAEDYLDVKGLRAELTYVKQTLDKLGVQVQIVHAGKYKDAGDTFTRTSMTPETREMMDSILDSLYSHFVETLARARRKSAGEMRAIIDRGPFLADAALSDGLIDGLRYEDQVVEELKQRLKLQEVRRVSHRTYARISPESAGLKLGSRVALVVADGAIVRQDPGVIIGEQFVSPPEFNRILRRVREQNDIKAVIVRIDSPGGDAFASDEIWREMSLLSKKKPVVISMSDTAASGGYYMAMTGDPILAYPGTFTGSIGVFFGKANLRGLYEKIGVRKELLTRGRFADIDSDYTPLTPEAVAKLKQSIDQFYASFISRVAEARKRPQQQIDAVAQGRVWLGSQAAGNGLVDSLGGLDEAIARIKQKAGIPQGEAVRLIPYPRRRSIIEQLLSTGETTAAAPQLRGLVTRLAVMAGGGMQRLMPYTIEVR